MRIYVPAITTAFAVLLLATQAFADCDTIKAECKNKGYGNAICDRAAALCETESAGYGGSQAPTSATDVRLIDRAGGNSLVDQAQLCCGGSESCARTLKDDESKKALAAFKSAQGGPVGHSTNGACEKNKKISAAEADVDAATAGACFVRAKLCVGKMNEWLTASKLSAIPNLNLEDRLDKASKACQDMTPGKAKTAMENALANADTSKDCSDKTASNTPPGPPSDNTGGGGGGSGGSGGGGSGSGSGSGINPQALMGILQAAMAMQQSDKPAQDPTMDCSNEAIAGCQKGAAKPASWNGDSTASMKHEGETTPQFNPSPSSLSGAGPVQLPAGGEASKANSAGSIPNGGTPMPGGGGGGGAQLGASGGGNQLPGKSGTTDIMHGERSGGFAQTNAAMTMAPGGTGGFSGYGHNLDSPNLDLAQYLPKDQGRKLAGSEISPASAQINGSGVNIWNRISDHIKSRCNQGLLRDCVP